MALMDGITVEQSAPLVGGNSQARLGGYLHDLRVVLSPQSIVRAELVLQLHQR